MNIDTFNPLLDFKKSQEVWNRLYEGESYFLSWGWIENWIRTLPESVKIRFVVISESDRLLFAFFMGENDFSRNGLFRGRGYYLNATGKNDYDDLCIEYNAMAGSTVVDFREVLDMIPGKWDELSLPGMDVHQYPGNFLYEDLTPYRVVIEREEIAPFVDLNKVRQKRGDYLSLLSTNTRAKIRRLYRKLSQTGKIAVCIPSDTESAMDIFNEMVKLHQKTWQSRGESGHFATKFNYTFHTNLIRKRHSLGEIQLLKVTVGGITLGCLYNFIWHGKVFFYQCGINYEFEPEVSPGIVCHTEAIQYNAACGHSVYDFLGGESRYKSSLSTDENRIVWAKIQKPRVKFMIEDHLRALKYKISRY